MKTVASERSLQAIASCESQENWREADAQNVWSIRLPAQCTSSHLQAILGVLRVGKISNFPQDLLCSCHEEVAIFLGWESPVGGSSEKRIATGQEKEATILFVCFELAGASSDVCQTKSVPGLPPVAACRCLQGSGEMQPSFPWPSSAHHTATL